jgi:threonine dehydratase
MLRLLDTCFEGLNISDFQYGLHDAQQAWPVFTVTAERPEQLDALPAKLDAGGYRWQDISDAVDVTFRAIPLRGDLLMHPVFLRLDFYERPGALHDFLSRLIRDRANLCYFNYRQSGERIGRALIGLDFPSAESRTTFLQTLPEQGEGYRSCKPVDDEVVARLTSAG